MQTADFLQDWMSSQRWWWRCKSSGMWRCADWSRTDNLRLAVHVKDASTAQLPHLSLPFTPYILSQRVTSYSPAAVGISVSQPLRSLRDSRILGILKKEAAYCSKSSVLFNLPISTASHSTRPIPYTDESCVILRYYAASNSNFLPTFRDNLSVPSSGVNILDPSSWDRWVRNCHYWLPNNPDQRSSHLLLGGSLKSFIDQTISWRVGEGRPVYRRRQQVEVVGLSVSVGDCDARSVQQRTETEEEELHLTICWPKTSSGALQPQVGLGLF